MSHDAATRPAEPPGQVHEAAPPEAATPRGLMRIPPGVRYMIAAAFFFSLMSVVVKLAGQRLPSQQMVLARAVVTLVISWALIRRAGLSPWGRRKGLLVLRGLLGFGGLSCFYWSVTHLPLAEATVIQYTNPIFTALLAALLLGERMRGRESLALLVSLAGVVLVARPGFLFGGLAAGLPLGAVGIALAGALFSAAAYVTVRRLGSSEHPLVIVLYFPLVATPAAVPAVLPVWIWPTPLEWGLLVLVGVTTQIAQVYMTRGLQLEPAGRATGISYLQIVFAAVWGVVLFGEGLDAWTLGGAALVVGGTLLLSRLSAKRSTPAAADPAPTGR